MRKIDEIIVHCAATRPSWFEGKSVEEKRDEIGRWHVEENKWKAIGYHYIVDRDGRVAPGRSLDDAGAHTYGHNANSIGVCLIGGHASSATDAFDVNYTSAQDQALRVLISELKIRFPGIVKVSGHNDYTKAKACPGFNVKRWLANKPAERPLAASTTIQASATQIFAGIGTAATVFGGLDGTAQIVALVLSGVIVLAGIWVFKERLRYWAGGVK